MTCKTCGDSGEMHDFSTGVCRKKGCYCMQYVEAIGFDSILTQIKIGLDKLDEITDKEKFLLENLSFLRNTTNQEFVFYYWLLVDGMNDRNVLEIMKQLFRFKDKLTEPESIRRCKQKLVNRYPESFGPFDINLIKQKESRQSVFEEWVVS